MEISIVVFYLFIVSSRDHVIPISHRPTAQVMKDTDRQNFTEVNLFTFISLKTKQNVYYQRL